jgi:hypothetical protein
LKAQRILAAAVFFLLPWVPEGLAADPEDKDWPCIQRKVPEVSAGMVWAGPPVEGLDEEWRQDEQITALAKHISARSMAFEDAQVEIDSFASALGGEKAQKLTLLFAATLDTINRERNAIIGGIQRYTRRQTQLAERIQRQTAELNQFPADAGEDQQAKRLELEERQLWDTRIFEERERSLTYICEQPVILEQRLFALAREMMGHLEN